MQPFEIIKVRLQTQPKEAPQYSGIVDCLKKIVKNEGPLALYKGSSCIILGTLTPLIGVGILGSVRFGLYENFKSSLASWKGSDGVPAVLTLKDKALAAFGAGIISSLLVVIFTSFSVLSNTQGSEFKSNEEKLIKSILAQLMQV